MYIISKDSDRREQDQTSNSLCVPTSALTLSREG